MSDLGPETFTLREFAEHLASTHAHAIVITRSDRAYEGEVQSLAYSLPSSLFASSRVESIMLQRVSRTIPTSTLIRSRDIYVIRWDDIEAIREMKDP